MNSYLSFILFSFLHIFALQECQRDNIQKYSMRIFILNSIMIIFLFSFLETNECRPDQWRWRIHSQRSNPFLRWLSNHWRKSILIIQHFFIFHRDIVLQESHTMSLRELGIASVRSYNPKIPMLMFGRFFVPLFDSL